MTELELSGRTQNEQGSEPRYTAQGHLQPVVLDTPEPQSPTGWSPQQWRQRLRDDEDAS